MCVDLGQLRGLGSLRAGVAFVVVAGGREGLLRASGVGWRPVQQGGELVVVHIDVGDGVQQAVDAAWEVLHAGVGSSLRVPGEMVGLKEHELKV